VKLKLGKLEVGDKFAIINSDCTYEVILQQNTKTKYRLLNTNLYFWDTSDKFVVKIDNIWENLEGQLANAR